MKKILSLFLAAIVSFSLFLGAFTAFAQSDDAMTSDSGADTATTTNGGNDVQGALKTFRERWQTFKDNVSEEAQQRREALREKSATRKEQLEQRREELRQKMEERRKDVLLRAMDIHIKQLNKTKERVMRMPNIEQSLKEKLGTEIDAAIAGMEEKKSAVEAASGSEAIKSLGIEIRELAKLHRDVVKQIVDSIHASRAANVIEKAERRADAMEERIAEISAAGNDVTSLETHLAAARDHIALAKTAQEAGEYRETIRHLKLAYGEFRSIVREAKAMNIADENVETDGSSTDDAASGEEE